MIAKAKRQPIWRPKPDPQEIANRLRTLRECNGLTLAGLSRRTGVAYQTLYAYESGIRVPDISRCIVLAEVFALPSIDLLLFGRPRSKWRSLKTA